MLPPSQPPPVRNCIRTGVYPVTNGLPFLGWRVYPTQRKLKRRNGVAFARRLRTWYAEVARGALPLPKLRERVQGWVAHAEQGHTWGLRRSLLSAPIGMPPCPNRRSSPAPTI